MTDELEYAGWTNGAIVRTAQPGAIRLFCLPYAGGGASLFRFLKSDLAPAVDVYPIQLPGRESRFQEPPLTELSDLVRALDDALNPVLQSPYVLFGHSMGAFIAFELARRRRRERRPGPALIVVSGARAPQILDPDPPVHREPANELLAEMKRLDGIPREILEQPEFVALLLPTLRADLTICETYKYVEEPPLECPIVVYGGEHDEKVPPAHLSAWKAQTTASFRLRSFPGRHFFFLNESRAAVAQALSEDLRRFASGEAGGTLSAPRTQVETAIAEVWRDVLRVTEVGQDDNFFDLGGNSLLIVQAHVRLRQLLGTSLSVLDLFRYPTIRSLATAMRPARPITGGVGALGRVEEESHHE